MLCRVGITTDLERRKEEHEGVFKNVRNWQEFGPFKNRDEAQAWEDKTAEEYGCEHHHGGDEPDNPYAQWYGYYFCHDGEKSMASKESINT